MAGHVRMTRPDMSVIVKQDLPVETVSMVSILIKEYNYHVFMIVMCLLRAHLGSVNSIQNNTPF